MTSTVSIPLWLLGLLAALSAWWVLDRIFVPSVRWFLRRRLNKVLDEIRTHLDIEIRPFQLTKRQVLIDRLVYDTKVMEAVQHFSEKQGAPREVVQAEALAYAKEIVPSFNAYAYFRLGYWLAKKLARLLYRVRMGEVDNEALSRVDPKSTVVFVMNHRSNMDYILVAFLAAERTTLSYAVGEWAKIWPLETLFKFMGAFFVRRNSKNPMYRLVLERYIHMATKEGVCQAVFLEGGLSRNGKLRPPKMGLVDYMLRSFDPNGDRDIIFIPVALNYDRTLEDRSLLRLLDPEAKRRSMWFVIKTIVGFALHNVWLGIRGKWRKFGYACVNFGEPISVADYCRQQGLDFSRIDRYVRHEKIEVLCQHIMDDIKQLIPILPVALLSEIMLQAPPEGLDVLDVKARVYNRLAGLQSKSAPVYRPYRGMEVTIEEALGHLKTRRLILEENSHLKVNETMTDVLQYYANTLEGWQEKETTLVPSNQSE
jgi:glycerol-3-phosphate O-acyltransferase